VGSAVLVGANLRQPGFRFLEEGVIELFSHLGD